jgi:outer membrane receptor protein involved in Fe transport
VNYKVTPTFRTFVNYAQSWFVAQGDDPSIIADPTYKTETAGGYDYGFKGSFLNERLSYTLCGFYATRQNVSVTGLQEVPPGSGTFKTVTTRDGDQLVRGFEADVSWTLSKELYVTGSYGRVNSIYTDFGKAARRHRPQGAICRTLQRQPQREVRPAGRDAEGLLDQRRLHLRRRHAD